MVLALDPTRKGGQDRNNLVTDGEPGAVELDFPLRATEIPQDPGLIAGHLTVKVRTPEGNSLSTTGRSLMFSDRNGPALDEGPPRRRGIPEGKK